MACTSCMDRFRSWDMDEDSTECYRRFFAGGSAAGQGHSALETAALLIAPFHRQWHEYGHRVGMAWRAHWLAKVFAVASWSGLKPVPLMRPARENHFKKRMRLAGEFAPLAVQWPWSPIHQALGAWRRVAIRIYYPSISGRSCNLLATGTAFPVNRFTQAECLEAMKSCAVLERSQGAVTDGDWRQGAQW